MKIALIALCATMVEFLGWCERRNRGKGSWYSDRVLIRLQGAFLCAALYVLLS